MFYISIFFIIVFSDKSAFVLEQMDELINIKFEGEEKEIWVETDDPKLKIKELYTIIN
jgi:hypothetical protein